MKIISGGQTGVDRAALDFAISSGIVHGGWCPRGRLAEDGAIPDCYRLQEVSEASYSERTERNVIDSDATLIIAAGLPLSQGTLFTEECARKHGRPVLVVCECDGLKRVALLAAKFLEEHSVEVLNVAGPRESQSPGLGQFVHQVLGAVLAKKQHRKRAAHIGGARGDGTSR